MNSAVNASRRLAARSATALAARPSVRAAAAGSRNISTAVSHLNPTQVRSQSVEVDRKRPRVNAWMLECDVHWRARYILMIKVIAWVLVRAICRAVQCYVFLLRSQENAAIYVVAKVCGLVQCCSPSRETWNVRRCTSCTEWHTYAMHIIHVIALLVIKSMEISANLRGYVLVMVCRLSVARLTTEMVVLSCVPFFIPSRMEALELYLVHEETLRALLMWGVELEIFTSIAL